MSEYYTDEVAQSYDAPLFYAEIRKAMSKAIESLSKVAKLPDHIRILDMGAGTGKQIADYRKHFGSSIVRYTAVEPSAAMRKVAMRDHSDFKRLRFLAQTDEEYYAGEFPHYDIVNSCGMLMCVEDPRFTLDHLAKSVAPGGYLIVEFDNWGGSAYSFWKAVAPERTRTLEKSKPDVRFHLEDIAEIMHANYLGYECVYGGLVLTSLLPVWMTCSDNPSLLTRAVFSVLSWLDDVYFRNSSLNERGHNLVAVFHRPSLFDNNQ